MSSATRVSVIAGIVAGMLWAATAWAEPPAALATRSPRRSPPVASPSAARRCARFPEAASRRNYWIGTAFPPITSSTRSGRPDPYRIFPVGLLVCIQAHQSSRRPARELDWNGLCSPSGSSEELLGRRPV